MPLHEDMKIPSESIASCGDTSCELLISPIPRPRPEEVAISVSPRKRRVVLMDTGKPNSLAILRKTRELLRARGIEVADEIRQKSDGSRPMDDATLDWIAREEGLILCGVAD
jgi:hypothetical protein